MPSLSGSPNRDARQKLIKARSELILDHPFFGSLAMRLALVEDPDCATAWADGRTLGFNPDYIAALDPEETKGLLAHEVMHLACLHQVRRKGRSARLWNMAGDLAINWLLLEAGLRLPRGFLHDPARTDMSVDAIYSSMSGQEGKAGGKPDNDAGKDSGAAQGSPSPDAPGKRQEARRHGQAGGGPEEAGRPRQPGSGSLPSLEGQSPTDHELDMSADPGRCGEVRDPQSQPHGRPEEELARQESQWRAAVTRAAAEAREQGRLPAGIERAISQLADISLDWRQILDRFLAASARDDYSWVAPNRRYLHQGLYLPSLHSRELPDIVVAVDTSGSIFNRELERFAAEISALLEAYETTAHVLYADAKVQHGEVFRRSDLPLELKPLGGGGTDFRPAFQWVEEQGLRPACLIYLTDLECSCFPEEPEYPVLWAVIGKWRNAPPFGEIVEVRGG